MTPPPHDEAYHLAVGIIQTLHERGHRALLAGGCVRDFLLERDVTDYDIATSAKPEEVEALFERTVPKGKSFGVISVILHGREFEVATFRGEADYVDGRRPGRVHFTDDREDAIRRDFTINGMFYDPLTATVIDHVGGRDSLHAREIRAIGDPRLRFTEDKLRMLRAVRLAAQLGFTIEIGTLSALVEMAPQLAVVSAERVRDELIKILRSPNRRTGFELLHETGLLTVVLPEVAALAGVGQGAQAHPEGDVLQHTLLVIEHLPPDSSDTLAWAALLHDIGKPATRRESDGHIHFDGHSERGAEMASAVARRLVLSVAQRKRIEWLVENHLIFMQVRKMKESRLKRLLAEEDFPLLLELHRLDTLASDRDFVAYEFCRQRLSELEEHHLRPQPLLNGYDLERLGIVPGPRFREILEWVRDEQLEGRITTHEEAAEAVRKQFGAGE